MPKEKIVIAGASFFTEKYFVNPQFETTLPKKVLITIKEICIRLSAILECAITACFSSSGKVYFETIVDSGKELCDKKARATIDNIIAEEIEFINGLELWYKIFILQQIGAY